VSTSDIIIVKPEQFLTTLDQAFNFENIENDLVAHKGILTNDKAKSLFGDDYQMFMDVLEAVGLTTGIAKGQYAPSLPSQNGKCFYIPSLRMQGEEIFFSPRRIQLVTSMRYPSISLIVALTRHLLDTIPNSQLILAVDRNKTRITTPESEVEIFFHGDVIEFSILQKDETFILEIVKACKRLSNALSQNRYGEAKFYFAVICEKHDNYIGFNFYRKRHILPFDEPSDELDDQLDNCDKCKLTGHMQKWSTVIKKVESEVYRLIILIITFH
jgi:hypothetical protein